MPSLKHSIQHLISAKLWDAATFNPQWSLVGFPGAHLLRGTSLKPRLVLGCPMAGDLGNTLDLSHRLNCGTTGLKNAALTTRVCTSLISRLVRDRWTPRSRAVQTHQNRNDPAWQRSMPEPTPDLPREPGFDPALASWRQDQANSIGNS